MRKRKVRLFLKIRLRRRSPKEAKFKWGDRVRVVELLSLAYAHCESFATMFYVNDEGVVKGYCNRKTVLVEIAECECLYEFPEDQLKKV